MSRDGRINRIFNQDPRKTFEFSKQLKIKQFFGVLIDERFRDSVVLRNPAPKEQGAASEEEGFLKKWLSQEYFIILAAFLRLLNQDLLRREEFFREFRKDFYHCEQAMTVKTALKVYNLVNDSLYDYLDLQVPVQRVRNSTPSLQDQLDKHLEKANEKTEFLNPSPFSEAPPAHEERMKLALESKASQVKWGFDEALVIQERVRDMHESFVQSRRSNKNFDYGADTLKYLLHKGIRKKNPGIDAKRILGYIGAALCLTLAIAALAYLTFQTAGLIHLTWIIPIGILAGTAAASGGVGVGLLVASTPKIINRFSSFFCLEKSPREELPHFRAKGMLV